MNMDEKLTLLLAMLPKALLMPLTQEALAAVPAHDLTAGYVGIHSFPFRVGRESRVVETGGQPELDERRERGNREPNNDLYLVDSGMRLHISRAHFQIEKDKLGYLLVDRGSVCGTLISGQVIERNTRLKDGDVIGVGAVGTPYIYRFVSFDEYELRRKS